MKELTLVLVAFWNTPAPLDNFKCSACGRWHVTSTVVMAAISSCTAMYCGSGYYDEQGAFHAPTPLLHVHAGRAMQPWTPACHTEQAMGFFSVFRKTYQKEAETAWRLPARLADTVGLSASGLAASGFGDCLRLRNVTTGGYGSRPPAIR
jgi:hypothetical protein